MLSTQNHGRQFLHLPQLHHSIQFDSIEVLCESQQLICHFIIDRKMRFFSFIRSAAVFKCACFMIIARVENVSEYEFEYIELPIIVCH